MKNKTTMKKPERSKRAFTLIEVAAVIAVLLALIAVLFINIQGYLNGTYRAQCILNQSNVQKAVRSYSSMNGLTTGAVMASTTIIGAGLMIPVAPTCKAGGTPTYTGTVPAVGVAYMTCSLAAQASNPHAPSSIAAW